MATKALVLFSGGLDSVLAAKTLLRQNIAVTAFCCQSSFFGCERAKASAAGLDIPFLTHSLNVELLELVKNPPNGYGKNLNPCLDCHGLMVEHAAQTAKEQGYHIIATGEVLGQRPFSQTRQALRRVEKISGTEILRPLSAKLLPETSYEKSELVRRGRLLDISGRGRDRQIKLAKQYGIKDYDSPAGGCLLTDPGYSERLGRLLAYWPDCRPTDTVLLTQGRVYWLKLANQAARGETALEKNVLLVVGRREEENNRLIGLKESGDWLIEMEELAGPIALVRGLKSVPEPDKERVIVPKKLKLRELDILSAKPLPELRSLLCLLMAWHAPRARGRCVNCRIML